MAVSENNNEFHLQQQIWSIYVEYVWFEDKLPLGVYGVDAYDKKCIENSSFCQNDKKSAQITKRQSNLRE